MEEEKWKRWRWGKQRERRRGEGKVGRKRDADLRDQSQKRSLCLVKRLTRDSLC